MFSYIYSCLLTSILLSSTAIDTATFKIQGTVLNTATAEPMPYVNIGIHFKNIGTISDREGKFALVLNEGDHTGEIVFSHIGFKEKIILISELSLGENTIGLNPETLEIPAITVKNRKTKNKKLGNSNAGTRMLHVPFAGKENIKRSERMGTELGAKIKIDNDTKVNGLNFFVTRNSYNLARFRVNFYSIENDMPDQTIINQNIVFDVHEKKKGWINVDLDSYGIYLPKGQDIIVSLTFLDDEVEEETNWFMLNGSIVSGKGIYRRDKVMGEWITSGGNFSLYLDATVYMD